MKRTSKAPARIARACVIIFICVLGGVVALRESGLLQKPELIFYDWFVNLRANAAASDDRIVIIGMDEKDLIKYGHPLNDHLLSQLLERLAAAEPCVIGVDIYRDLPEPRTGEFLPELETTLKKERNVPIMAVCKVPDIGPPQALVGNPERIVASNFPKDILVDGRVRRAYLFVEDGDTFCPSMAGGLATAYLESQHVPITETDDVIKVGDTQIHALRIGGTTVRPLTPHAGGYVRARVAGFQILCDFRGPRKYLTKGIVGGFPTHTFDEVLSGKVAPEALRDRIVLVGTITESVKDDLPTPIHDSHRGLLLHAMVINQLLRSAIDGEPMMSWWPETTCIAWIALWTALGGVLGFLLRSPGKLVVALALLLGAAVGSAWIAFTRALWIPAAAPALGCFFGATFATFHAAWLGREERKVMQTLLAAHLSGKVAKELWANRGELLEGGRLRPRRLTATVLFTDLKSFTTTSEGMDPAALMNWLNEYMVEMTPFVDQHGGIVSKFIGDAIMAVFGVPIQSSGEEGRDRDAANAVECALAMARSLDALNERWRGERRPTTEMRIGIYTGPVVAGSVGGSERMEFTVHGDTVNIANRLESMGKDERATGPDMPQSACIILIGDSTLARLHGRYRTMPLGPIPLKGKHDLITVHRLVGLS